MKKDPQTYKQLMVHPFFPLLFFLTPFFLLFILLSSLPPPFPPPPTHTYKHIQTRTNTQKYMDAETDMMLPLLHEETSEKMSKLNGFFFFFFFFVLIF